MMHRKLSTFFLIAVVTLPAARLQAEVTDAAPGGFTVSHRLPVPASRAVVYAAAVNDISKWWISDRTVSGDAANLYLDARPMGCFCERIGEGAGLVHMLVTFINPGVMLRLTGGLGPLGLMGVNGNLTLEFDDGEQAETSTVTLRYAVGGYRPGGLEEIAPAVDQVLGEQLQSLVEHVRELQHD